MGIMGASQLDTKFATVSHLTTGSLQLPSNVLDLTFSGFLWDVVELDEVPFQRPQFFNAVCLHQKQKGEHVLGRRIGNWHTRGYSVSWQKSNLLTSQTELALRG